MTSIFSATIGPAFAMMVAITVPDHMHGARADARALATVESVDSVKHDTTLSADTLTLERAKTIGLVKHLIDSARTALKLPSTPPPASVDSSQIVASVTADVSKNPVFTEIVRTHGLTPDQYAMSSYRIWIAVGYLALEKALQSQGMSMDAAASVGFPQVRPDDIRFARQHTTELEGFGFKAPVMEL